MKYAGGTFSGIKLALCVPKLLVIAALMKVKSQMKPELQQLAIGALVTHFQEVHSFLGTMGVLHIFIRNFAHRAHHLVKLTRKDALSKFGSLQIKAQEDLKDAILNSPALKAIDYTLSVLILTVDTSYIAVGYILCQCDTDNPTRHYYSYFGSIMLKEREACFLQLKLKIYGLFHS